VLNDLVEQHGPDPRERGGCGLGVRVRHEHGELIAPDPGNEIRWPDVGTIPSETVRRTISPTL
jgi:hypothetical protein